MTPELAELSQSIDAAELGRRIKNARLAAGLTQAQLAGEDVTTPYVSRIEDGQRRPGGALLEKMAERLGTTVEALLLGVSRDRLMELQLAVDHAELALASGDGPSALKAATKALGDLPEGPVAGLRRAALTVRAGALEVTGDLDGAIRVLEDITAAPIADPSWLKALIALSRCYRDSGDLSRAVTVGEDAVAKIEELGLSGLTEAIQLSITVAGAYMLRGDNGQAKRMCLRAVDAAEKFDSPLAKASAYWNASLIEANSGNTALALGMAKKALTQFELSDDARNLVRLRTEVAIMQLMQDPPDPDAALVTLEQAERESAWAPAGAFDVANRLRTRAQAHYLRGEFDLAREYLAKGVDGAPEDAPVLRSSMLMLEGKILASSGQLVDARSRYTSAAQLLTGAGADREAAQLWYELGELLGSVGDSDGALDAFKRAGASTGLRSDTSSSASIPVR